MKTKEIEVWARKTPDGNWLSTSNVDFRFNDSVKAKLIVEVPEQKIEISLKQLWDALGDRNIASKNFIARDLGFDVEEKK